MKLLSAFMVSISLSLNAAVGSFEAPILRFSFFWDVTQSRLVVSDRRFGTDRLSRNVCYCRCTLRSAPEGWRFQLHLDGNLKSRFVSMLFLQRRSLNSVAIRKVITVTKCNPLGRPRRRWVDNIRMDLQEVGCGYMDSIGLVQDRDRWRTLVSVVWTFGFHEMRGISWLAADQLASQEGLCTMR